MIDEHDVRTLFYDDKTNRFTDDSGDIVNDIFKMITPGQFIVFRRLKRIYITQDVTNSFIVELVYESQLTEIKGVIK